MSTWSKLSRLMTSQGTDSPQGLVSTYGSNQVWWHPRELTTQKGWCRLGVSNWRLVTSKGTVVQPSWCRLGVSNQGWWQGNWLQSTQPLGLWCHQTWSKSTSTLGWFPDVTSQGLLTAHNPCGLSVPWDVTSWLLTPSRHQPLWAVSSLGCHQPWLLTPSRHQPLWAVSSLGCHWWHPSQFPGNLQPKSTPTLVGCQFPGMSPALITYSKSTPTLVGCQFPGMSPDLITAIQVDTNPCGLSVPWDITSLELTPVDTTLVGCQCHQTWTVSRHQPLGLSVPWDVPGNLQVDTTLVGCQFPGMSPALITYSKSTPTLVGCQFPGMSPASTYLVDTKACGLSVLVMSPDSHKSTPTLVGCQFPGMSPALITYSKSTPTLVGCQFPGMSPALLLTPSRHQPLWAVSSLGCHQPWLLTGKVDTNPCGLSVPWDVTSLGLLTPSRHQPLWAVSSLGCHQPWITCGLSVLGCPSRHQPLWAVSSLGCHQTWLLP